MSRSFALIAALLFTTAAIAADSPDLGEWVSLFNGKDAAGWVKAKPGDAQGRGRQSDHPWKVVEGALTNSSDVGMDLATEKEFSNFELEIEYKLPPGGGNSGVYLRGQMEVQVCSTSPSTDPKDLKGGDLGGVYGFAGPRANPKYVAGDWNKFQIRCLGNRVTALHNGILVQDNTYVDRATGGAMSLSVALDRKGQPLDLTKGPIMLQGDHSQVWYRNIRIRPLCAREDGWKPLWNDKDLSEFNGGEGVKGSENWEITKDPRAFTNVKGHDLWTNEKFHNFLVYYEYRSDPNIGDGNSGFYLRDQWELQINKSQGTGNKHGDAALYDRFPPLVAAANKPGEWNALAAKVQGMKIWAWQNGKLVHDGRELKIRTDSGEPAFDEARPFKLQGDHDKVWFRNLWIKPLDK